VDVDPTSTIIASGAADNTVRLWDIKSGKCLKVWDFNTAVKRVEFNEDGSQLLAVTEKRMGFLGTIVVLDIKLDVNAEQSDERALTITCEDSKATVAGWSYMSKYIIAGHEDGSMSQYDGKVCCEYLLSRETVLTNDSRASYSTIPKSTNRICQSPTSNGLPTGHTASLHPRTRLRRYAAAWSLLGFVAFENLTNMYHPPADCQCP
jgi:translation initiation factor 3 subunit I